MGRFDWRRPALAAAVFFAAIDAAAAHGFGQRFDLPLPLQFWVVGAGLTIVLTFVVTAFFVGERAAAKDYPRIDLLRFAVFRWIASRPVVVTIRALALAVFLLAVYAGFFGSQDPYSNIIVTMVWIVWWVGFAFTCALIGNVWRLTNPLQTIFRWGRAAFARITGGGGRSLRRPYPAWLATWPAVFFYLAFAWGELVWPNHDLPAAIAAAILLYAIITLTGMAVYGGRVWLERGEAFTVGFGVLARFAPLDIGSARNPDAKAGSRQRHWYLRPYGAGLLSYEGVSWSYVVFVLLMLSTVTFDGFLETPLFQSIFNKVYATPLLTRAVFAISEFGIPDSVLIKTIALVLFPTLFVAIYALFSWAMAALTRPHVPVEFRTAITASSVARAFVLTLVPIAVAYHLSHYFSLLLTAGQFIVPLASDPLGVGWNLFGTADFQVDIGFVSPKFFWYSAVTLIVIGHVSAVYVAHIVALRFFHGRKAALISQLPMVALMVAYTMVSLWILAQPIMG